MRARTRPAPPRPGARAQSRRSADRRLQGIRTSGMDPLGDGAKVRARRLSRRQPIGQRRDCAARRRYYLVAMPRRPFRYPISKFEQWRRKRADALMRRLGRSPHVVRAQGARFLVDTIDYIDQCIAWEGMWDGPQLDRLAALCEARRIDCFVDVGA